MWESLARFIIRFRWLLLLILIASTALMAYHAAGVQMSYEYIRAIPEDNPKYQAYQSFRKQFGEDGNMLVVGIQTDKLFTEKMFNDYAALIKKVKTVSGVEDVLSIPEATNLVRSPSEEKLMAVPVFPEGPLSQSMLDSNTKVFFNLPFYRGLLYNAETSTWLAAIRINKDVMNSKVRNRVVQDILKVCDEFGKNNSLDMHYSGLPLIRTNMATKIATEMQWFLLGSFILSAIILLLFFRSFSATALSLIVVLIGVVWSLGTIEWFGYRITILNGLIPPLIVVIGIPNCIYFLNKYHTAYNFVAAQPGLAGNKKMAALTEMISRMGVVTLFLQHHGCHRFCGVWPYQKRRAERIWRGSRYQHHCTFFYLDHFYTSHAELAARTQTTAYALPGQ